CTAADGAGNPATPTTFRVSVEDHTAPVLAAHGNETREATGPTGAIVTYASPAANDTVDGSDITTCSPASGSLFALGNTTVTCDVADVSGNAAPSGSFVVSVVDTTPPTIAFHADATAEATGAAGANVTYDAPSTSDVVD